MSVKHRMLCFCALGCLLLVWGSPAQAQEKPYSMPAATPLYSTPPFPFHDNRMIVITFTAAPEVLRELVPDPLVPNPANLAFLYIGSLNFENPPFGRFNYLEAGIGVPAVFPKTKTLGNYAVCLYLNKALPVVPGREIWGWPKKDAELTFTEKDGEISGRVERFGTVLVKVRGKLQKKLAPGASQPQMPWFLQKIIPSARRGVPPDVWQLVSQVNIDNVTTELWDCSAELEFASGPQDPLGRIKVLGVVNAQFSVGGFTMDYGDVIHDYLIKK